MESYLKPGLAVTGDFLRFSSLVFLNVLIKSGYIRVLDKSMSLGKRLRIQSN